MGFKAITRTDITSQLTTAAAWNTVDVSSYVTLSDVSGVVIEIAETAAGDNLDIGFRPGSSTEARTITAGLRVDGRLFTMVGIDGSNQFDFYQETDGDISMWIIGEVNNVVFPDTHSGNFSITKDGTKQTVDLATWTGGDTATGFLIEVISASAATVSHGVWDPDSTDTGTAFTTAAKNCAFYIVGTDASEDVDVSTTDADTNFRAVAYFTDDLVHNENRATVSLTVDTWSAAPAAAGAANGLRLMLYDRQQDTSETIGARTAGTSGTTDLSNTNSRMYMVVADSSGDVDCIVNNTLTNINFYDYGYISEATGGLSITPPTGPWYGADGKQIKQHPG